MPRSGSSRSPRPYRARCDECRTTAGRRRGGRAMGANSNYDVARDGRFLHVQQVQPTQPATRVEVVLNGLRR